MSHTVEEHFDGRSAAVREIYDTLVAASREFGKVEEDPKKTSIHLNRKSAFAGIQTQRNAIVLTQINDRHRQPADVKTRTCIGTPVVLLPQDRLMRRDRCRSVGLASLVV